jgi:hypothetical protein
MIGYSRAFNELYGPKPIEGKSKMNQRIQELAYEAEDYADSIVDQGGEFHPAYTKKFAELIVRDCIAIVAPSSYRRAYPENYRGGIDCLDTLDERVGAIKDHFGIE